MPELLIGLFAGIWVGMDAGFDASGSAVVGGVASLLAYMGSCLVWPYRACFVCGGRQNVGDGRGNFRHRWSTCLWCRGAKENRRLGARLLGRG
jgi:hypothetical protein